MTKSKTSWKEEHLLMLLSALLPPITAKENFTVTDVAIHEERVKKVLKELKAFITKVEAQAKREAVEECEKQLQCEDCMGTSGLATLSSFGPCGSCDGTGFNQDASCEDQFNFLKSLLNPSDAK